MRWFLGVMVTLAVVACEQRRQSATTPLAGPEEGSTPSAAKPDPSAALEAVRKQIAALGGEASPEEIVAACAPGVVANALKEVGDLSQACGKAYLGLAGAALDNGSPGMAQMHLANMRSFTGYASEEVTAVERRMEGVVAEQRKAEAALAEKRKFDGAWIYRSSDDPMTGRQSRYASVESENTVSFDFPYQGEQRGTLLVRDHASHGRDVIFSVERGQLLCQSYDDCTVRVRFDEGEPRRWNAVGPSDNSSTQLFLRNEAEFRRRLQSARVVRIEVPVYQEGAPTFEFKVGGFDPDRFKKGG